MHVSKNIPTNSPCHGCQYRYPGCHDPGRCLKEAIGLEGYTAFKKKTERERLAREKRAKRNNDIADIREQSIKRAMTGKKRRG